MEAFCRSLRMGGQHLRLLRRRSTIEDGFCVLDVVFGAWERSPGKPRV